jgi:hypothetical protein
MENQPTKPEPGDRRESGMSGPGPIAVVAFAVVFFGFLVCASGVVIASIPAVVGGFLMMGVGLTVFACKPG